ncbi:MAG TPA: prepilin-type N-terminal cleavage/methylation domain-containing protein [Candidatus Acidoferrales bacterium]|jgi:general secretion pathway protein G|nr:prepilin-type N-terminal cleavage/methylation domain-containing protein [Candidatus Acidoferrales bacterium]
MLKFYMNNTAKVAVRERGVTLLEMIIVISIILILMGAAVPVVKISVKRQKETELRRDLWEMRDAIDRYHEAASKNLFQVKLGTEGYPPDLDTLVNGVEIAGGKKLRFLRRVPVDPMTGNTDWGLRSMQDDPQSDSWGGQDVFDIYTKSDGTGLNGQKYKDW